MYLEATDRLTRVSNGLKLRRSAQGVPYLPLGKFRLEGDAGTLTAICSRHEHGLLRRVSGLKSVLGRQRIGEEVHLAILADALPELARLGRLQ